MSIAHFETMRRQDGVARWQAVALLCYHDMEANGHAVYDTPTLAKELGLPINARTSTLVRAEVTKAIQRKWLAPESVVGPAHTCLVAPNGVSNACGKVRERCLVHGDL